MAVLLSTLLGTATIQAVPPAYTIIEIPTLGGAEGEARGINNAKDVVGTAGLPVAQAHAFLWKNGSIRDLGDLGDGSLALFSVGQDVNDSKQVVGYSQFAEFSSFRAFLWEEGVMYDLNALIPAGSGWELTHANAINEAGQIVGRGIAPSGNSHAFLLSPAGALAPPGVPADMSADKLDATGSTLLVSWDATSCAGATDYQILFGGGSGFPATPGGDLTFVGASCTIDSTSPYSWSTSPDPAVDPTGLIWWLVVATDGEVTEGSWGRDGSGFERQVAGGGASLFCGTSVQDLSNGCP